MGLYIHKTKKRTGRPTRAELACALSDIYMRLKYIIEDMNELYVRQSIYNVRDSFDRQKQTEEQDASTAKRVNS
ncbi:MAG: hypothetical protein E7006_00700 [Alphaproteobacteria bacterium]|nr:hypothetical protein [Alphaproteobacteria bacterium]